MSSSTTMRKVNRNLNPVVIIIFSVILIYTVSLFFPLVWGLMTSFKHVDQFDGTKLIIENGVYKGMTRGGFDTLGLPDMNYWKIYPFYTEFLPSLDAEKYEHFTHYDNIFGNYYMVIKAFKFDRKDFSPTYFEGIFNITEVPKKTGNLTILDFISYSLLYAVGGSIVAATTPCLVGYLCAKYKYRFSSFVYSLVIFVMVTPIIGTTPATINLLRQLRLYDSFYGHFVHMFAGFGGTYFLLFYAFFYSLSNTYNEAAEVDGASQFRTMITICMPLAMKLFSTIVLLQFVSKWNDYNTPMLYIPSYPTLSYALLKMRKEANVLDGFLAKVPVQIAEIMFLVIPTLTLFICFKNQLMGNLNMGGIKE